MTDFLNKFFTEEESLNGRLSPLSLSSRPLKRWYQKNNLIFCFESEPECCSAVHILRTEGNQFDVLSHDLLTEEDFKLLEALTINQKDLPLYMDTWIGPVIPNVLAKE